MEEDTKDGSYWCPKEIPVLIREAGNRRKSTRISFSGNNDKLCSTTFKEPRSSYISLAPTLLRFPYNDTRHHNQRLTLWNKTINSLKIRIKSPDPEVFLIHLEGKRPGPLQQLLLYGNTAKTISIKCNPGCYKMAKSSLSLFLYTCREECECLELPLEIYPSTAWFNLPKTIVMPDVTVGRRAHAIITLPHPQQAEKFFVTFQPSFIPQEPVTLTPMNGTIGGKDGIRQLKITYSPMEYTTVSCAIRVHFPGLSSNAYHEIQILGRCRPGREAEEIRKEIKEIENFRPKPKRKKKYPRIKFKGLLTSHSLEDHLNRHNYDSGKQARDLLTMAGVMHFFVRNKNLPDRTEQQSDEPQRTSISGIEVLAAHTDLDHQEKLMIYNTIKKKFGLDFEEGSEKGSQRSHEHKIKRLKTYQRKDWEELQRLVGVPLFGKAEELPKYLDESGGPPRQSYFYGRPSHFYGDHLDHDHHHHHRRSIRKQRLSAGSGSSGFSGKRAQKSISEEEKQLYKNIREEVPKDFTMKEKFIQIARLVILRWRADKRIAKLRILIEDTKKQRLRKSSVRHKQSIAAGTAKKSMHFNAPPGSDDREAAKSQNQRERSKSMNPRVQVEEPPAKEGEEGQHAKDEKKHVEKKTRFSKKFMSKDNDSNSNDMK